MMIDIVLATFNGEFYLEEQIKSIQNNHQYLECIARLIIVDDGSTDKTAEIVRLLGLSDTKIEWLLNSSGKHGPSNNFAFGLEQTHSQYIMLSDQDDVWQPDKIELSIQKIKQLERKCEKKAEVNLAEKAADIPLLVFSDKEIVDENLQLICGSYFELKNIPKDWHMKFEQLCQQNVVSGCTMLFNRALLNKAMPIPQQAYMHDWWLALVASRCGKIAFIDQPLIKYRQHHNNTIGANKRSKLSLITQFNQQLIQFEQSFLQTIEQAKAFESFEQEQQLNNNRTISILANIKNISISQKISLFAKKTINRSHLFGIIALLIVLLRI